MHEKGSLRAGPRGTQTAVAHFGFPHGVHVLYLIR